MGITINHVLSKPIVSGLQPTCLLPIVSIASVDVVSLIKLIDLAQILHSILLKLEMWFKS